MVSATRGAWSGPRYAVALAVALSTGAAGFVAVLGLYLVMPVGWLPVSGHGNWTVGFAAAHWVAIVGWSAAEGVLLMDRILGEPPGPRLWRRDPRGWVSLVVCCIGIAAGSLGSVAVLWLSAPVWGWATFWGALGRAEGWVVALGLWAAAGVFPTLGLLAARGACRRWVGSRVPPEGPCVAPREKSALMGPSGPGREGMDVSPSSA